MRANEAGRLGRWDVRRAGTVLFGTFLWLQLTSSSLARELALVEPDAMRVTVYLLPLVFLAIGALWPIVVVTLLLFPTSFGAALIVSPPATANTLSQPLTFGLAALTLLAYLVTAGSWLRSPSVDPLLEVTRRPFRVPHDRWRPYRGTVLPRLVLLVLLFVVTAAAVPLFEPLVVNVAASFGTGPTPGAAIDGGLVLTNLILFFMWCFLAYALFLAPALELESRVRRLETQMQANLARAKTTRRKIGFVVTVLAALGLMAALLLMRYR